MSTSTAASRAEWILVILSHVASLTGWMCLMMALYVDKLLS